MAVPPDRERLEAMGRSMRYRGPDDTGLFVGPHIGLVHRRLTIRDLSAAGRCPMASADGRLQLVFNGEIYNWRELRSELEAMGCTFSTRTDTEVILRGYEMWGEEVIPRLRGMFAIGLWDAHRRTLLLARDRMGEKPLFYGLTHSGLAFASTLVALEQARDRHEIDATALAAYLCHSFIPSSHTIWQGASVLRPAHWMTIGVGTQPSMRRYWEFPRLGPRSMPWRECATAAESALDDSVARCLDADVPVGVYLSGGVDSSLVTALAARHQPGISAFSLGFSEQDFNEVPYARRVASHLQVAHHVFTAGVQDLLDCLPHLVVQYGQPFGDASAVPSYLLARLAREYVKVCLSGDGGDESFGGYWRIQAGVYANCYRRVLPTVVRERLVPKIAPYMGRLGRRWTAINRLASSDAADAYTNYQSWFNCLDSIAGPGLQPALEIDLKSLRVGQELRCEEASVVQRLQYDDFQIQLPDDYLTKVDVASMAASLEVRCPFLDQTVLELAWCMPDAMKLNLGRRKWLLKRIASRSVPPDAIYRPKMGFALPLPAWFRGRLGDVLDGLMRESETASAGWIKAETVRRLIRAQRAGESHETRLWLVLWLELWFRLVVQRECLPAGWA
jgi:asparagine synthase (glutamine-hydrolysing)